MGNAEAEKQPKDGALADDSDADNINAENENSNDDQSDSPPPTVIAPQSYVTQQSLRKSCDMLQVHFAISWQNYVGLGSFLPILQT